MSRKRRSGFGDVTVDRARFDRGEAKCPTCKRPIGPADKPSFVHHLGAGGPRLATLQCGRCQALLTVRFEEPAAEEA